MTRIEKERESLKEQIISILRHSPENIEVEIGYTWRIEVCIVVHASAKNKISLYYVPGDEVKLSIPEAVNTPISDKDTKLLYGCVSKIMKNHNYINTAFNELNFSKFIARIEEQQKAQEEEQQKAQEELDKIMQTLKPGDAYLFPQNKKVLIEKVDRDKIVFNDYDVEDLSIQEFADKLAAKVIGKLEG